MEITFNKQNDRFYGFFIPQHLTASWYTSSQTISNFIAWVDLGSYIDQSIAIGFHYQKPFEKTVPTGFCFNPLGFNEVVRAACNETVNVRLSNTRKTDFNATKINEILLPKDVVDIDFVDK